MKLPVEWIREYVDTPLDNEAFAAKLTMAGLEVEEMTESDSGVIFHMKVTPNRGDWLSVVGVAREGAAALDLPLKWQAAANTDDSGDVNKWAGVLVTDASLCPRYTGKVIRNVTMGQSPAWMQDRLTGAGMRPLNVVVDITNYVMLELGQPLHAFDLDSLPEGKVVVRPANAGEEIVTLDGVTRPLTPGMLVICDRESPICIAGVMGSEDSEVTETTQNIFLESAHFDPGSVRRTSKALNLTTEASYRFERFVDPALAPIALERAADLLAELVGGEVVSGRIDYRPSVVPPVEISLRPARTNAILGTALSTETVAHALRRLGLEVSDVDGKLRAVVPSFRPDLVKEIDLIEEVGRMVGYDILPETLPPAPGTPGGDAPRGEFARRMREALIGLGVREALTHSLAAPSPFDDPNEAADRVMIRLALSAELSGLRQSLISNLLEVLARNLRQRQHDVRIFEVGKVFSMGAQPGEYKEDRHVAVVLTGAVSPFDWSQGASASIDFFAAKGVLLALFERLRLPSPEFAASQRHHMHPGRCADVIVNGQIAGFLAELDPDAVKSHLDAPAGMGRVAVFELNADLLLAHAADTRRYAALPRYPAVNRDLAVVVDLATSYGAIEAAARNAADSDLLAEIALQSIYSGERVTVGKKSVALRFTFRNPYRTLTDEDVEFQMQSIESAIVAAVGAARR